ncbi:MAG TPA: alpha/beta hydrolase [Devosiaceae bacterium]
MASEEAERIRAQLFAEKGSPPSSLEDERAASLQRASERELPQGVEFTDGLIGGVECEWAAEPEPAGEGVFLFLHGGGYQNGAPVTHRALSAGIAKATHMRVLLPAYRLAPEHPFPAAVQDALAVYGGILDAGIPAERVVVGGLSAGGGLALALMLALRDAGAPLPGAAVLLSPWTDLTLSSQTYETLADVDPCITRDELRAAATRYLGEARAEHPLASPLFAPLHGLPPILIQVGAHEAMLGDSSRLAERVEAAGGFASLKVWPEMWHGWHQEAGVLPEADAAIAEIGDFVREKSESQSAVAE